MTTADSIRIANDVDVRWPARELLDALALKTKVRRRVGDYLRTRGIENLSLRDLMDLFLPSADVPVTDLRDCWAQIPIFDQPQFGWMLHDQALLALTDADFGPAYRTEWALRMCKLMLHELRVCLTPAVPVRRHRQKAPRTPAGA